MRIIKKEVTEESALGEIYKNVKMGADAIINLLPSVGDDALRSAMTQQLDGYEKYAAHAEQALHERGCKAKEEGAVARFSAKMGMAFNTMVDSSTTHIAEMMIEGSNMGITDLTRLINHLEAVDPSSKAARLAREVVRFEERNLEELKRYL
ncbi:MAG: hypothetical protein IJA78_00045 [Clostridia bacterium]|nr:hypothetical protein [Clostridia bacterium]